MTLPLPQYVIAKPLASGATAFYFNVPTRYRKAGCSMPNEPLGNDYAVACGADGKGGRARKAYLEKVAPRSRPDYERTMLLVSDIKTKKGDRIGDRRIRSITPISADKIYEIIIAGPRGARLRQGEKAVALCRRAWRVVHRLYPAEFDRAVPNPWDGVTRKRRTKKIKAAVTREQVYQFAWGCIEGGQPEAAAETDFLFDL